MNDDCRWEQCCRLACMGELRRAMQVLRSLGNCVHVVDTECVADVWEGCLLGVSCLGAVRGASLGVLVWVRSEQHVYVVEHDDPQAWRRAVSLHAGVGRVPWAVSTVGAPKKKRGFGGGDHGAVFEVVV